jgi:hypothetical protein
VQSLADLLNALDDAQVEAVAMAAASEFGGVVGAYGRVNGWSAAVYNALTGATLHVDAFPTRRAALVALILLHDSQP